MQYTVSWAGTEMESLHIDLLHVIFSFLRIPNYLLTVRAIFCTCKRWETVMRNFHAFWSEAAQKYYWPACKTSTEFSLKWHANEALSVDWWAIGSKWLPLKESLKPYTTPDAYARRFGGWNAKTVAHCFQLDENRPLPRKLPSDLRKFYLPAKYLALGFMGNGIPLKHFHVSKRYRRFEEGAMLEPLVQAFRSMACPLCLSNPRWKLLFCAVWICNNDSWTIELQCTACSRYICLREQYA